MTHYYSPHTGEIINADTPADWMGSTDIAPPTFDAQTQGLFYVDGAWAVVNAVPPAFTFQQLRAAEYALKSTGEQFAMQYDDAKNGTTTWLAWQDGIKAKYPKPV
jgi:hypothetical protein